ncbi:HPF/RaiA family ribosome-associated protein [Thiohalobacter sp. IOR34]|uniref:HPF/RaiA family ribosome-associated protein n=1 Tax=Thiohalobacter sp. IOR34 TaxID=3057176 RepID=UPI0025B1770F|nr:HPF/RaiA family ribosome-associated protein [Thiohalobacter sp. IOR34]WJW74798.1 HPF/RaiA family ribosome-associated protein [Thiohalobacter sp. IOR34]
MQIDIQTRHFSLTDALRGHVQRRLAFALSARTDHIQRVVVRLFDVNGPRGGTDKCCHVQVVLSHLPDVIIKDTEADLYTAIDRATDRAGRAVGRRLGRQRIRGRSGGMPAASPDIAPRRPA